MMIFTIGYEGLDIERFIDLLAKQGVETVVDIRELPLSRKPGFSKRALQAELNASGREYVHLVELGCPRDVRDQYKEDGNWKNYTKGFLKHLKGQQESVAELAALATSTSCALLCYEADPNYCHRSMVADAVGELAGMRVHHIVVRR
jgi:uncharacterized protein (DUF488 family)